MSTQCRQELRDRDPSEVVLERPPGTSHGFGGLGLDFQVVRGLGARGTAGTAGEFGWTGAYHSTYWGDTQEDLVVVYFTQLLPAGGLDDQEKLKALVYQAITESRR